MTWLEWSEKLRKGAEKARAEGNVVVGLLLSIKALECAQIAHNLGNGEVTLREG